MLISIQSDREWAALARVFLGDTALATDPRFATNVARCANRAATDAAVAGAFAALDATAAVERLAEADVAFAFINDMAGLSGHPHLRRITVETPAGPVAMPAPAAEFKGAPRRFGSVPAIGDHGALPGRRRRAAEGLP